ncbi:unnamed protein product [Rhizoctonia solani]|nr:unnamed protein product [Rhizoctonia solani]
MSRPSAPGVSVDLSGAARVAARRLRGLGKAFPIDFTTKAGTDNELMAWYRSRPNRLVHTLQLRRERERPYFHQFVVFKLGGNGGVFRIDRRLRPNEDAPMNSLKDEGIPAYDTIQPVVTWNDPLFPASDCLISIDFQGDVYLALILKICQLIQAHPLAKVYTLQRYNCYFFAQTIMLCAARGADNQAGTWDWPPEWVPTQNPNKDFLKLNEPAHELAGHSKLDHMITPINAQFTYKGYTLTLALVRRTYLPEIQRNEIHQLKIVNPLWGKDDAEFLHNKIFASAQHLLENWKEEQARTPYQNFLNISKDFIYCPYSKEAAIEVCCTQETQLGPGQTDALIFEILRPSPFTISNKLQPYKLDSFGICSPSDQHQEQGFIAEVTRWKESCAKFGLLAHQQDEEFDAYVLRFGAADIPQYRPPRRTIFRWRKAKQMIPLSMTNMQIYLVRLIDAHSIRVEQYQWLTKAIATEVASDIRKAMDEVWDKLIE